MKRAKFELKVTPESVLGGSEADSGSTSVGGLAHRLGMLRSASSAELGRISLAKFVELSRRQMGQTLETLAKEAGLDITDLISIEKGEAPVKEARVLVQLAAALGVDAEPLLALAGLRPCTDERLTEAAALFTARAESVKPLDSREEKALGWFKKTAFRSRRSLVRVAHMRSPRLADPRQAKDFRKRPVGPGEECTEQ